MNVNVKFVFTFDFVMFLLEDLFQNLCLIIVQLQNTKVRTRFESAKLLKTFFLNVLYISHKDSALSPKSEANKAHSLVAFLDIHVLAVSSLNQSVATVVTC